MLIATDLDGTLVPHGADTVSPYTADVLRRVDALGIPVVFVTARPLRWMDGLWPFVGEHGLAIVSNGAVTYDVTARRILSLDGFPPSEGLALVDVIRAALPESTFAIECADGIRLDPDFDDPIPPPPGSPRGPLAAVWDSPAVKVLVRHREADHDALHDAVMTAVGDRGVATWSVPGLVEISPAGVTKASALAALCAARGVPAAEVVAFGDMPNDIPMLAWAGTSYAMAGAHGSVLDVADHVAPPAEEDGVARVLEALLLGHGTVG
ncbi:MAG: HAD family hydrolase [Candidatus Nanopelagicales bacterium]